MAREYQYTIQAVKPLTNKIIQVIATPKTDNLIYQAGQYVTIRLTNGEEAFFSIANAPLGSNHLEFHIRHTQDNWFTTQLLEEIKQTGQFTLIGPLGNCIYQPLIRPTILLAGGTGFAPIKAIIEQALYENSEQSIYLYWGAKTLADLYLNELPQTWATHVDNFHFTGVLSEPSPQCAWQGATGWLHDVVLQDFLTLKDYQVYASGPYEMVMQALTYFQQAGLDKTKLYSDAIQTIENQNDE